ncbi:MAG: methionyl-tRNA formyltransferase, partial [Oscillospiraceae bacterium]
GNFTLTPQDENNVSLAPPLTKEMAKFTFCEKAQVLHNKIRGQNPWPGAYFTFEGKNIKVLKAAVSDLTGEKGEILSTKPLIVATGEKSLELITLQPEGSKAMEGKAWAMGRRFLKGDSIL